MSEILLKPIEFQGQVDEFKDATAVVGGLKCAVDKEDVSLQCVDKLVEGVKDLNSLIESFTTFATMDGDTMQRIKAKWMHTDSDIATKTLGEILLG
ncbi:MAG: hypothetical protein IKE74_10250 [Mogibacterium sp.]|nr:hypothetical protein [Mogibacterium sp.]